MDIEKACHIARDVGLQLERTPEGLALSDGTMTVRGDFARMTPRIRQGALQREMLVKAARLKGVVAPHAVDATAGLGEDSLLLAAAGFQVLLYERNPVIAALLADALVRARDIPGLADPVSRMELVVGDSVEGLARLPERPDLVLLDPMFPAKHGDARAKKKLQLLQRLEEPCRDEEALFEAAHAAEARKIVVKRPLKGPFLANRKPSYSLRGKTIRYDCYVC